jgi:hypothetical protein
VVRTGRKMLDIPRLEADLANRRTHLAELLLKQTQQRLADEAEDPTP